MAGALKGQPWLSPLNMNQLFQPIGGSLWISPSRATLGVFPSKPQPANTQWKADDGKLITKRPGVHQPLRSQEACANSWAADLHLAALRQDPVAKVGQQSANFSITPKTYSKVLFFYPVMTIQPSRAPETPWMWHTWSDASPAILAVYKWAYMYEGSLPN